jgi:hypothetical protein
MRKLIIFFIITFLCISSLQAIEKLTLKSKDKYSGNLILIDKQHVVFLINNQKFEFTIDKIESIDFKESDDEFELVLTDKSVLKGSIVDQDNEFYTVGSAAGLTTINKQKIVEIRNNNKKYKDLFSTRKFDNYFHIGMIPYTTFILNDVKNTYQSYWSYKLYFESTFFTKAWFGFDISFMMLIPAFGTYNDFLFCVPINFTVKYEDNFYRHKDLNHWSRRLYWHIKFGFGFSPIIFAELADKKNSVSLSVSSEADYGIKFYPSNNFGIGITGTTSLLAQKTSYMIMQSAGLILEFKF